MIDNDVRSSSVPAVLAGLHGERCGDRNPGQPAPNQVRDPVHQRWTF